MNRQDILNIKKSLNIGSVRKSENDQTSVCAWVTELTEKAYGHFVRQCKWAHNCRKCQRPHNTLLHVESQSDSDSSSSQPLSSGDPSQVVSNTAVKLRSSSLLMTCCILVCAADGTSDEARALLDNRSTSSFISEHLVQTLQLPRSRHDVRVPI